MRLSAKVAYNTLVQIAGKFISTLLALAAVALITRYLGQTGYGEYTTVLTFLSFFSIIADFGLTLVTVQMISRPGADENRILSNLFGLRLVSAIFFLGLAPLAVLFFPYDQEIKLGVLVAAPSFLFIALNQVLVGLFQKRLRLDRVALAETISRLVLVAGVYAAIAGGFGLTGILAATVLSGAVNFLFHFLASRRFAVIGLAFEPAVWREIMSRSWPLALTIVFNLIYLRADTLLLSLIKRPTEIGLIAEVGLYGAAYRVIDVLITVPYMFAGVILPLLTAYWAGRDKPRFGTALQRSFDLMIFLAVPLAVGAQFVARDIMVLVAGAEFAESGPILAILIFAAALIYVAVMPAHAIIALNQQKKIIGAYAFVALTSLIGYFAVIPKYSYYGAAWVTIYSEVAIALATFYIVWRYAGWRPRFTSFGQALAASLAMAAALYFLASAGLYVKIPAAALVYGFALFLAGGFNKDDLRALLPKQ